VAHKKGFISIFNEVARCIAERGTLIDMNLVPDSEEAIQLQVMKRPEGKCAFLRTYFDGAREIALVDMNPCPAEMPIDLCRVKISEGSDEVLFREDLHLRETAYSQDAIEAGRMCDHHVDQRDAFMALHEELKC
jgi:hypothetical protein